MLPPTKAEALALLRKGADGRKNFVAWFMEKVIFHTSLLPISIKLMHPIISIKLMHPIISIKLVGK